MRQLIPWIVILCISNVLGDRKTLVKAPKNKVSDVKFPCASEVYCHGEILETVQLMEIHEDSKTFVDRPLKISVKIFKEKWSELPPEKKKNKSELEKFLNEYFGHVGDDLENILFPDWKEISDGGLPVYQNITSEELKKFAKEIHGRWNDLGRKVNRTVEEKPEQHSLIYLPHPFVVAGGRYQDVYYWDSFWVIQGLLVSGMQETAQNMILNFVHLINKLKHVPNGNRVYYEKRSQPPLLAMMVDNVIRHPTFNSSQLNSFLEKVLPALEQEHEFWMNERSVQIGEGHVLNVYKGGITTPRPEGYREDLQTASNAHDKARVYAHIAAAAESGWDFSTRWLDTPISDLGSIRTEDIVPVDLNAFLCAQENLMSRFYGLLNKTDNAKKYEEKATVRANAIHEVFWNENIAMWRDYDLKSKQHRSEFYLAHLAPIWTRCSGKAVDITSTEFLNKVLQSDDMKNVTTYPGGFPASRITHQDCQWDLPNAWPNLQLMLIEGFAANSDIRPTALTWARKWLTAVHSGFKNSSHIYEKYDAFEPGQYGGGGEYEVQEGFGWTNGGILRLLELFPELTSAGIIIRVQTTSVLLTLAAILVLTF